MNESIVNKPAPEVSYCLHCNNWGHDIYQCMVPGKERKINWLHQQEAILEGYKAQKCQRDKGRNREHDSDSQRREAIAVTRKLTNPSGKNWNFFPKNNEGPESIRDHTIGKDQGLVNDPSNASSNTSINQDTQVKQIDKIKTNTPWDEKGHRSFDNPQLRYKTSVDKEPLNQFSHKPPLEQTQYYQSEVLARENTCTISDHLSPQPVDIGQLNQFPHKQSLGQVPYHQDEVLAQANNLIGSDQLPPNSKLRERSTVQAISSCDYPLHLNEAKRITREKSRDNAKQTREYLPPRYLETTPNSNLIKKSVHFRDSADGQDRNYHPKGYNPILITPRPSYPESSVNDPDRPKGIISPKPWLDGKGKYFSGTVENGQGGDFYGYYFSPTSPINPIPRGRYVPTSTPNVNDDYPDQSVLSRQTELIVP